MGALTILAGLVLMIVIHEGAHFVAAKAFDMKATEAFFGFGPRLWSTTRGETEYGIKAIPFGGYVRIIGMNPFEEVPVEDEGRTYRVAPFWQKAMVVLAGIFSHFVWRSSSSSCCPSPMAWWCSTTTVGLCRRRRWAPSQRPSKTGHRRRH